MPYHVSARAYLKRARNRLNEGTQVGLFYAAFELRAGIQARMQEYLQAQEGVAKHKKDDWRLGKLAHSLEEAFQIGDRIAQVAIYDAKDEQLIDTLYYTPVTSALKGVGERLGEFLHAMQSFTPDTAHWWRDTRAFLETVYVQLDTACFGTLLAPLLKEHGSNHVTMRSEILDETAGARLRANLVTGFSALMNVRYLEELPGRSKPARPK